MNPAEDVVGLLHHQLHHARGAGRDAGVMGGDHQRRVPLGAHSAQQVNDLCARVRIQIAGRFVGED